MSGFPFDIVGFDLDGTLLDTHRDLAAAVNHALVLEGREPIAAERVRDLIGGGARKMLARALDVTGGALDPARFEELHEVLLGYYEKNIVVETCLFPGGEAMLDELAERGVQLAVVTNKLERFARQILDGLGLTDRFFTVIGGDTLGPGRAKPNPDLIELMLSRGPSGRAVYVGDTTYDTRAATAAGLPCVVVGFGFNDAPADELGGTRVIAHFNELVPTLTAMGPVQGS